MGEKKGLFNFTVESTGALRPEEIVLRGVEVSSAWRERRRRAGRRRVGL